MTLYGTVTEHVSDGHIMGYARMYYARTCVKCVHVLYASTQEHWIPNVYIYIVHVCMSVGCSVATTRAKDATLMIVASTPDLTRTELQLTFKIARATKLLSLSLSPCFSEVMAAFLC